MSLPWLQPFLHKGVRSVTGGREGSFEKLIFPASRAITQREAMNASLRPIPVLSPKPADSQSDACELKVRRHGLSRSSVCHRSLLILCRQARLRISSPIAMDTCVLHHTSNIKHLTSLPAFLCFSKMISRTVPMITYSIAVTPSQTAKKRRYGKRRFRVRTTLSEISFGVGLETVLITTVTTPCFLIPISPSESEILNMLAPFT